MIALLPPMACCSVSVSFLLGRVLAPLCRGLVWGILAALLPRRGRIGGWIRSCLLKIQTRCPKTSFYCKKEGSFVHKSCNYFRPRRAKGSSRPMERSALVRRTKRAPDVPHPRIKVGQNLTSIKQNSKLKWAGSAPSHRYPSFRCIMPLSRAIICVPQGWNYACGPPGSRGCIVNDRRADSGPLGEAAPNVRPAGPFFDRDPNPNHWITPFFPSSSCPRGMPARPRNMHTRHVRLYAAINLGYDLHSIRTYYAFEISILR